MTQSGRSEEPSARPAREGIVLPSDGGEPLLPGMTGAPGGQPTPVPPTMPPPSAPPGGQAWGTPWGPDQNPPAQAAAGQSWGGQPGQTWGRQDQQPPQSPQAPQGQPPVQHGQAPPSPPAGWGTAPAYGSGGVGGGAPLPAPQPPHVPGQSPVSAPLPPVAPTGPGGSLPPAGPAVGSGFGAVPPPADEGATQYIPPVAADDGATQVIPPVAGALPPEVRQESTQVLGRARQGGGARPTPPAVGGDADATQYLPPVPGSPAGGERQPPSEFDNLFRSESPGPAPAGATQHLLSFQQQPPQRQPHDPGYYTPGSYDAGDDGRGDRRSGSRLPLIAAVGVGIAVLGIGAGALLAGGGEDDDAGETTASPTASVGEKSAPPAADPAKAQAVALDKLLADSGTSRTAVISAVADVKSCDNLGNAAEDLRNAARQRKQLVTDLSKLSVDELPDHAALTGALTNAWQASASADEHYAAWADQVAGDKKLCKKGHARSTGQTGAGNRASGTASEEKKTAARLWNVIAGKYGLTERQPTQL